MQVGLSLSYDYNTNTIYTNPLAWTKNSASSFGIAPCFRYYFTQASKFSFFYENRGDLQNIQD